MSRRTFITAGLVGAAALVAAGWLRGPYAPGSGVPRRALDADGEALFGAVAPVLLAGALPAGAEARAALDEVLDGIDRAIAGLSPAARAELAQLVALLSLPPVRLGLARISPSWREAAPADVRAFLDRCRASSTLLLRATYDALHQLTFAAWYGNPKSWPAIGYPGPPALEPAS
ncbi:MAG: hypothetical protein IT518_27305 [Burkholderiales bacterium]|nr:hypothetical protein [Burkholderiales bacterium]